MERPPAARTEVDVGPLIEAYDSVLFDLDGVVYKGPDAIPGASDRLAELRWRGLAVAFVTNNAARPPEAVAAQLTGLGLDASPDEVVTSAQAAAGLLAPTLPNGANVLVVGGAGLVEALESYGLKPVFEASADPQAVVQGFHPDVGWRLLAEGAYALATGVPWVASNTDRTLPTERGLAPGNGTLIKVLEMATGRTPLVAGKPNRPVFDEAVARIGAGRGAERPLVVGDRLDTDIEGARNAGLPSLLVLTGVSRVRDLLLAPPAQRPDHIAWDLGGMFATRAEPEILTDSVRCGGWEVRLEGTRVILQGKGERDAAIRALAELAWRHADPAALDFSDVPMAGE